MLGRHHQGLPHLPGKGHELAPDERDQRGQDALRARGRQCATRVRRAPGFVDRGRRAAQYGGRVGFAVRRVRGGAAQRGGGLATSLLQEERRVRGR